MGLYGRQRIAVAMLIFLWFAVAPQKFSKTEQVLWDRVRTAQVHLAQWRMDKDCASDADIDPWRLGLLGVEWNLTTTTLGDLVAKRTACRKNCLS